jgi:hypothetical protein
MSKPCYWSVPTQRPLDEAPPTPAQARERVRDLLGAEAEAPAPTFAALFGDRAGTMPANRVRGPKLFRLHKGRS